MHFATFDVAVLTVETGLDLLPHSADFSLTLQHLLNERVARLHHDHPAAFGDHQHLLTLGAIKQTLVCMHFSHMPSTSSHRFWPVRHDLKLLQSQTVNVTSDSTEEAMTALPFGGKWQS